MKKHVLTGTLILTLSLSAVGCSADRTADDVSDPISPVTAAVGDPNSAGPSPDSGGSSMDAAGPRGPLDQRPDRQQDILGKVVSVTGNKVVVTALEMPEGWSNPGTPPDAAGDMGRGVADGGDGSEPRFFAGGDPGQAEDMRARIESMTEEERQAFMQEMPNRGGTGRTREKIEFAETATTYELLVPVGLSIWSGPSSIDVSGLQEGNILSLWVEALNEGGSSKVIYAQLIQS